MSIEPTYYAVIPAPVRYDKTLPPAAKLLYGEITALCTTKGYCWAGNKHFADLYEVSEDSVSLWISKLKKSGHIRSECSVETGYERRLYLSEKIQPPSLKNSDPLLKKFSELSEEIQRALLKNSVHSNTLNNTQSTTLNDDVEVDSAGAANVAESSTLVAKKEPSTPPDSARPPASPKKVYGDGELQKQTRQFFRDNPDTFPESMYPDFLDWWTEIVQNSERAADIGKERWRAQNTWTLSRRLSKWHTNYLKDQQRHDAANRPSTNSIANQSRHKTGNGRPVKRTPVITPDKLRRDGQASRNANPDGERRTIILDVDGGSQPT